MENEDSILGMKVRPHLDHQSSCNDCIIASVEDYPTYFIDLPKASGFNFISTMNFVKPSNTKEMINAISSFEKEHGGNIEKRHEPPSEQNTDRKDKIQPFHLCLLLITIFILVILVLAIYVTVK